MASEIQIRGPLKFIGYVQTNRAGTNGQLLTYRNGEADWIDPEENLDVDTIVTSTRNSSPAIDTKGNLITADERTYDGIDTKPEAPESGGGSTISVNNVEVEDPNFINNTEALFLVNGKDVSLDIINDGVVDVNASPVSDPNFVNSTDLTYEVFNSQISANVNFNLPDAPANTDSRVQYELEVPPVSGDPTWVEASSSNPGNGSLFYAQGEDFSRDASEQISLFPFTPSIVDADYTFSNNEITFNNTGVYKIFFEGRIRYDFNAASGDLEIQRQLADGNQFVFYQAIEEVRGTTITTSTFFIVFLASGGDKIRLIMDHDTGNTPNGVSISVDDCNILIERNVANVIESGNLYSIPSEDRTVLVPNGSPAPFDLTPDVEDSDYSYDTSTREITINSTKRYKFFIEGDFSGGFNGSNIELRVNGTVEDDIITATGTDAFSHFAVLSLNEGDKVTLTGTRAGPFITEITLNDMTMVIESSVNISNIKTQVSVDGTEVDNPNFIFNNNIDATVTGSDVTINVPAAGTGGHTIENVFGQAQPARSNLQFSTGLTVTDDAGNDRTIVTTSDLAPGVVDTFNNSTDWTQVGTTDEYTIDFTHNLNSDNIFWEVYDSNNTGVQLQTTKESNARLRITLNDNERFAGRIYIERI